MYVLNKLYNVISNLLLSTYDKNKIKCNELSNLATSQGPTIENQELANFAAVKKLNLNEKKELGIKLLTHSGGKVSDIVKAEKIFSKNITEGANDYEDYFWWGEALCYQGRVAETEEIFFKSVQAISGHKDLYDPEKKAFIGHLYERYAQSLQLNDKLEAATYYYQAAIDCNDALNQTPHSFEGAKFNLEGLRKLKQSKLRKKMSRWPYKLSDFADFRKLVFNQFVDRIPSESILNPESRVLALGSCFAQNMALALKHYGVNSNSLGMGELINSTYANRYLIDWSINSTENTVPAQTVEVLKHYYGTDPNRIRALFEFTDIIIFTLGVAPCFFNKNSGIFHLSNPDTSTIHLLAENEFRTTTVDENVGNLLYIVNSIRKINTKAKFFFTVSPVPLVVTFEYPSAITADCISKSVLRVSIDHVLKNNISDVYYWPSFEIVRWLGAYHYPMYGSEDGTSRHVSEWVIKIIMDAFVEVYGKNLISKNV